MYRGNNYLWCKQRFMWGTEKWSPAHSYPFISFLIPFLTITVNGAYMTTAGGVICGLMGAFLIVGSGVLFFIVAGLDPGIHPTRRFSAHSKHCLFVDFKYRAHFITNGFLQFEPLTYCTYCFGIQPYLTEHWRDWDQWIRMRYCHSLIFLKCIGQRNMQAYIWWLILEIEKYFFMFIISCAGMAYNVWAGLFFFFCSIGFLIAYGILIVMWAKWIYLNRINLRQTKKQIAKEMFRFLFKIEIPPSKYVVGSAKVQQTNGKAFY